MRERERKRERREGKKRREGGKEGKIEKINKGVKQYPSQKLKNMK